MTDESTKLLSAKRPSDRIEGVYIVPLEEHSDERGVFMETFRREWFPWVNWDKLQSNVSHSRAGVLRGLHYHRQQIDYWYVTKGVLRAGLVDLRPSSPTYRAVEMIEMGDTNPVGLFIPVGVAHGFVALTDVTLVYIVNRYYDGGQDEYGVAWNDPDIRVPWGVDSPLLSERDRGLRPLKDIPPDQLPR